MTEVPEKNRLKRGKRRIWLISLGALVVLLVLTRILLPYFVLKGKYKHEDVHADTADFRKVIDDLVPLTVNYF